jgi:transcriptional regulator with XRE-family HTH domain
MSKFSDIVKTVRSQAGLSQSDFATKLGVSSIYISKIETGQKEASRKFVQKLAYFVGIHPATLAPFLFYNPDVKESELTSIERQLISLGEQLQQKLIKKRLDKHEG